MQKKKMEKTKENMKRENCIICMNKIFRGNKQLRIKERRKSKDLTCSRKCSKIYVRVVHYVMNNSKKFK